MTVSFQTSKDGKALTVTPSGLAFLKTKEMNIYNGQGDDVFKGNAIHQLYMLYGVDIVTLEKINSREDTNATTNHESISSSGDPITLAITIAIMSVGLFFLWIYQTVLHPLFNFLFN